jgi:hypothetical protein
MTATTDHPSVPLPELQPHSCPFTWCRTRQGDQQDHWGVTYFDATLRHGDPYHLPAGKQPLRIGIGVAYEERTAPAIVVHLEDGRYDYDADAFLRIDEAVQIRDALDRAITGAHEALHQMTEALTLSNRLGEKGPEDTAARLT